MRWAIWHFKDRPIKLMEFGPHLVLAMLEGLVQASVLTLTALGLSLVFGVMRVVNVAHGEFFMLGAVFAYAITDWLAGNAAVGFLAALIIAPILVAALAIFCDWMILRRLEYDPERTIVATIGILYVLQQVTLMTYGPDAHPVTPPFNQRLNLLTLALKFISLGACRPHLTSCL